MDREVSYRGLLTVCAILGAVGLQSFPAAQSLASIARQEEARRTSVAGSSKVVTNADLTPDFTVVSTEAKAVTPAAATEKPVGSSAESNGATAEADAARVAEEAERARQLAPNERAWRLRTAAVRERIEKAKQQLALLTRAPHPDPREEAKIESMRQKARESLGVAENALKMLETEAELEKVPRAWLQ
jgi:hypothetical protein